MRPGVFILLLLMQLSVFAAALLSFSALATSTAVPQAPEPKSAPSAPPASVTENPVPTKKEDWSTPVLDRTVMQIAPPLTVPLGTVGDHSSELIQVQWRPGDPIDLYVIKPVGVKKPPVILYLFGFPTETDMFKQPEFQSLAVKGGYAGVGFVSALTGHRFHDRALSEWFVSDLTEALATSAHDVQMVLDYLATRDDLDMTKVGMFGQGSGASVGILAAAVDHRIKALDALNPWGDWPDWLAKSTIIPAEERSNFLKPDFQDSVAPLDPVTWLPKLSGIPFRLQEWTYEDETPAAAKAALRMAAPRSAIVVRYETLKEYSDSVGGGKLLDWLKDALSGKQPDWLKDKLSIQH